MKPLFSILISLHCLSCYKAREPVALDAATKIAGVYDLTYSYYSITGRANESLPGSLTLIRTNAQSVKPVFQIHGISDGLIEQGTWQLMEISADSIHYRGSGYGGGIKSGKIDMVSYADATFFFQFTKRP